MLRALVSRLLPVALAISLLPGSVATAQPATSAKSALAVILPDLTCPDITFHIEFDADDLLVSKIVGATVFCTSPNGTATELVANTFEAAGNSPICPQTTITGTGTVTWLTTTLQRPTSKFTFVINLLTGSFTAVVTSGPLKDAVVQAIPAGAPLLKVEIPCAGVLIGLKRLAVTQTVITFTRP